MEKKVAIIQSSYIPWKGYFDIINTVDEFVLFDDVQYTRRDWRNRNRIKTSRGAEWLTIPVQVKGKYFQKIRDTKIGEAGWAAKHLRSIEHNYSRAPHFAESSDWLRDMYKTCDFEYLSEVNHHFLARINGLLGITTPLRWSHEFELDDDKNGKLIGICRDLGATEYLSGPSARDYIREEDFTAAGITVSWADYTGYPEYDQLYPPFDHYVSVLDLILNQGAQQARGHMKSFGEVRA